MTAHLVVTSLTLVVLWHHTVIPSEATPTPTPTIITTPTTIPPTPQTDTTATGPDVNNGNNTTGDSSGTETPMVDSNPTSTESPSGGESGRLARCRYEFKRTVRNEIFEKNGENLPLRGSRFTMATNETRCYLTRSDLAGKLEERSEEAVEYFALGCLNPAGTDIVVMEDEEAEVLEASYGSAANATSVGDKGDDSRGRERNSSSSPYHFFDHAIGYFQTTNCRINLKAVDIVANFTDLCVLSVIGNRAWNLTELLDHPELCRAFRGVQAFAIIGDWSTSSYLSHLALCDQHLHNVAEMDLTNDSLTEFPPALRDVLPNLRALEVGHNNLTSPVDFPWQDGFAALPRNLSRTYQFNVHYNFLNSFDMDPHLFRRVFLMNSNSIANLTHFRFSSQFQYISLERNGLSRIAAGVFDDIPSLQFLSLAHNKLETLPAGLLDRLPKLRRLDLQGNRLMSLPTDIFRNVRLLERLNMEHNQLQVIQEGLLSRLYELREVKLKNNVIVEVKMEAFSTHSVKLKTLELQDNPLRTFPVIVLLLRGLLSTNLDNTDITSLDFVDIGRQTTVSLLAEALKNPTTGTYVDLKDNPAFQKVISLRDSRLRSVVLYNETRETFAIFMLVVKYFTIHTQGSRLACDCHILNVTHKLQEWSQDGTLSGKEACLQGWKCVWPSELAGTRVAALKDEQTYCPLEEGNESSCPKGCTCYLRTKVNSVIVDCKNAGLTSLPARVPGNTRELWLQNNTLQSLEKRAYLSHLTSLKLTANNVQELPIDVLLQMPELTLLHVDDNWLTGLHQDFARLPKLQEVRLAGNPFRCDCTTRWMKAWILSHQLVTKDWTAVKCTTEDDDGQVLTSVADESFVCKVSASLGQLAVPVAVPVSLAFLLLTAAVLAFIQRRRLKVLIYIHTGYHPFDRDPPDHRALYDVTVICDVAARAWVLRHVIETLEEGGRYKVFFYCRDAFAGFTVAENVRHCVHNSKRAVLVLGTGWDRQEALVTGAHEALARCLKDLPHFLTVLLHQGLSPKDVQGKDLRQYVHRGRYIATDDKHLAKKLLYEMPHLKPSRVKAKGPEGKQGRPNKAKGKHPPGPEPVPLYDIVAVAEKENGLRGGEEEGQLQNGVGGQGGGWVRQVSHNDVDVDLRLSGVNHHNDLNNTHRGPADNDDDDDVSDDNNEENVNNEAPHLLHPPALQNQMSTESQVSQASQVSQVSQVQRHVFVWYASTDLTFTLSTIVEPLERRGHRCILEDRDFPPGAAIQENIVNAVESSSRVIFVLSDRTMTNDWFTFAFHVAFDRQLQSRGLRVALVSREEVDVSRFAEEIQQVIRASSGLTENEPWFWKRLNTFVHYDQAELP